MKFSDASPNCAADREVSGVKVEKSITDFLGSSSTIPFFILMHEGSVWIRAIASAVRSVRGTCIFASARLITTRGIS